MGCKSAARRENTKQKKTPRTTTAESQNNVADVFLCSSEMTRPAGIICDDSEMHTCVWGIWFFFSIITSFFIYFVNLSTGGGVDENSCHICIKSKAAKSWGSWPDTSPSQTPGHVCLTKVKHTWRQIGSEPDFSPVGCCCDALGVADGLKLQRAPETEQ